MEKGLGKLHGQDVEKIRELINFAKKVVENEEDKSIKIESYKIILNQLISEYISEPNYVKKSSVNVRVEESDFPKKQRELAELCSITVEELNDVFKFKDDTADIIAPINNSEPTKRSVASQCYLAALEVVFSKEWIDSRELAECMRSIGVKEISNLAKQLKRASEIFRVSGTRGNNKYKLTSGIGRKSAFNMIHKLAKGETIEN